MDTLVLTVLSQNTNDANSLEGFRRLKARFHDWGAVERAPWRRVVSAIRVSGLGNTKARRIQEILRRIHEGQRGYSLGFLKRWDMERARAYLLALPGVGPKTAACVLLFGFGWPVFPVDTHIHRVSIRLGLIDGGTTAERAHSALQLLTPDAWVYPLHMLIIRHGRAVCHARRPECGECVLGDVCPYGRERGAAG